MSELVLTLRAALPRRIDASPLAPDRVAKLSLAEIERLPLRVEGGESVEAGELFRITGTRGDVLRFVGDLAAADCIGSGMTSGTLSIDGKVGRQAGMRMTGGRIEVSGDAGDGTGLEMSGGAIVVRGSVGRRTGAALPGAKRGMTGGEIVVLGDAGAETGACMRRGVIAVAGLIGPDAARAAIAGTVVAAGDITSPAGRGSKRASLVALAGVQVPPTYVYACTYRPSYLAVLLTHLRRTYGFPVRPEQATGLYRLYSGDMAETGRGEILHWTGE